MGWWQGGGGMRGWRVRYAGRSVVVGGRAAPPGTALWGCRPPFTPFESLRTGFAFPQRERTPRPRAALPLWVSALAGMTREGEGGRSPILTFPPRGKGYPATPPLWIPAFAGTTMGVRAGGRLLVVAGEVPLLRGGPLREPQGERNREWRLRGLVMGVRRPVTPLWIPAFAGMTMEVGLERRLTETPPRRAPALDTGFRRYDGGGVRAGGRCWWWGSRSGGTGDSRIAPTTVWGGVGVATEFWDGGYPPGACLGKGLHRNDACGRPFDRLRANGIANRPYDGVEVQERG